MDKFSNFQSLQEAFQEIVKNKNKIKWKKIQQENLSLDYVILFSSSLGKILFDELERLVEYYSGELTKVKIFGKYHQIPREQVAYGDTGVKYTFSNVTVPARPWFPLLEAVRNLIESLTSFKYNFVLINRYRNGNDHIGEHRDDEKELDKHTPITSLSFGQQRTFVLKHRDARLKGKLKRNIAPVKMELEHGSVLLMNWPTNEYWYHSVPQRKKCNGVRINLTFRKITDL
ncbi:hypothetical protein ABEB36_011638 [Hypothenemus hampei]|uniref:DNA oxidative demethylase ALKBH2 n=1 Tax=Hypothenemus hampei TaxID=57062 RepID=A0ABD1E8I1_HYPHA